ncbi:MAG: hypothetical protein ACYS26_00320 [Planctomycetota bacterium]|jgi:hypothetical protein
MLRSLHASSPGRLAALTALLAAPAAAQVGGATWAGGFDLQAAIDAAPEGGVVLVPPGQYDPFTIDGKGLDLVASGAGLVTIGDSTQPHDPFGDWVTVRNLPAGSEVRLAGFRLELPQGNVLPPLTLQDCQGPVALISLAIEDDYGFAELLRVERCDSVSVSDCRILGYDRDLMGFDPPYVAPRAAVRAIDSTVFLTGCQVRGMDAAPLTAFSNPNAGAGLLAEGSTVVATACQITGGDGQLSGSALGPGAGGAGGAYFASVGVVSGETSQGFFGGAGEAVGVAGGFGVELGVGSTLRLGVGASLTGGLDLGGVAAPDVQSLTPNQLLPNPTALPSLTLSPGVIQPGGVVNVRIHGEPGTNRVLWYSLGQSPPTPLPVIQAGLSVLDGAAIQLAVFPADGQGLVAFPFPINAPGIEGLSFLVQSVEVLSPFMWNLSAPAFVAVGP